MNGIRATQPARESRSGLRVHSGTTRLVQRACQVANIQPSEVRTCTAIKSAGVCSPFCILPSPSRITGTLQQRAHRQSQHPRGPETRYVASLLQKRPLTRLAADRLERWHFVGVMDNPWTRCTGKLP